MSYSVVQTVVETIKKHAPNCQPKIGIVLGSGLGNLVEHVEQPIAIPYQALPGFPLPSVSGHAGNLILGKINGVEVVCLQGRHHTYEHGDHEAVKIYVRTLKWLGCQYFLATNASGAMREDFNPGDLVLIKDHINFQGSNPLVGPNDDEFGPRFPPLDNAYDSDLRQMLAKSAAEQNITLHEGVYLSVLGPCYETAAEIRAFRLLGADLVGMSTVPEVIVANHCGLKVAVIATITNYATGLTKISHSHEAVVATAAQASYQLVALVKDFIKKLQTNDE